MVVVSFFSVKLRFIGCLDEVASFKQIKLKWKIKANKNSMKSRNSREKGKFEFSEEKSREFCKRSDKPFRSLSNDKSSHCPC